MAKYSCITEYKYVRRRQQQRCRQYYNDIYGQVIRTNTSKINQIFFIL